MNLLFYLLGLLIGVAVFFYVLSLYHSGADALAARRAGKDGKNENVEIDAASLAMRVPQVYPRDRVCPLCRAVLTKYEVLYATRHETPEGARILIHGCRYCYRPGDENAAREGGNGAEA